MKHTAKERRTWPAVAAVVLVAAVGCGTAAVVGSSGQGGASLAAAAPSATRGSHGISRQSRVPDLRHKPNPGSSPLLSPSIRLALPSPRPTSVSPGLTSPSPSPTGSDSWAWCSSDPSGMQNTADGFILSNNEWNQGEAGPQQICGNSPSDWQVTSTQRNLSSDPGSVKTYPNVQENYPNVPLSQFSQITSNYSENMHATSGTDAEAAYDLWLGNTSQATDEVMYWVDNAGQSPGGSLKASNVSFGGQTWDLWSGGGTYFAWVLHGMTPKSHFGRPSGSVDILAGLQWLVDHGYLSSGILLRQIGFGWEICVTANSAGAAGTPQTFTISNYTLTSSPA
jgi:hypothetical protein